VRVTLVDRNNYHLFQPLLYQVASAGLEAPQIAFPVRAFLRRHKNARFLMGSAEGIDPAAKVLMVDSQPGTGRHTIPKDVEVTAVIDHHEFSGKAKKLDFVDVRAGLGATCST